MKTFRSELLQSGNKATEIMIQVNGAIGRAHKNGEELHDIEIRWSGDPTGSGYTANLRFVGEIKAA